MLPPGLRSPQEVLQYYDKLYYHLIDSGRAHPFIYPWCSIGAFVACTYLLFDHRGSRLLQNSRFVAFAFVAAFQAWCLLTNKALNPAAAFGVGLISAFGTLWVFTLTVVNDCQADFQRIERRPLEPSQGRTPVDDASKTSGVQLEHHAQNGNLKQRPGIQGKHSVDNARAGTLYWQSYPTQSVIERLDWVTDMFFSFRGVGWNWQTGGIPPPPKWVESQLNNSDDQAVDDTPFRQSKTGIRRYATRNELLKVCLPKLAIGYILLDAIKTAALNDSYFWGYTSAPAPAFYPDYVRDSYTLTKCSRLLISLSAVYIALWTIFTLGPLFFCGILGPRWYGVRGEAWMNPADMFGSFSNVFDKGLAGWWGGWWHQTFRYAFEAPTTRLLQLLQVDKRSNLGKTIALFTAFFLSGCLHAAGSYTQLGDTRPMLGPMRFFLLQALAIWAQTLIADALRAAGLLQRTPKVLKQLANFMLVHLWLYHTAPLLVDDFAQGGVWLFEPVPISIFRGLGLGPKETGWWCNWNAMASWRTGKGLLDTGLAL